MKIKEILESASAGTIDDYLNELMMQYNNDLISYDEAYSIIWKLGKSSPSEDLDFWFIMLDTVADQKHDHEGGGELDDQGRASRHLAN